MNQPIEKLSLHELIKEWQNEVDALQSIEKSNPDWMWAPLQSRLERLHALGREIGVKKAQDRAKWQP